MEQILFICTGNTCRSAMAEVYFNHKIKDIKEFKYYAESAGTIAQDNGRISSGAAHALLKNNIMIPESYHSNSITSEMIKKSEYIFVMTTAHKDVITDRFPECREKVHLLSEVEKKDKDIPDPVGLDNLFFEKTFLIIKNYIDKLIELLKNYKSGELNFLNKKEKCYSRSD